MSDDLRTMLGAMILAVEEDPDATPREIAEWFTHWMTRGKPPADGEPHLGDCVKFPMTCHRCLWDDTFSKVDKALDALAAERRQEQQRRQGLGR